MIDIEQDLKAVLRDKSQEIHPATEVPHGLRRKILAHRIAQAGMYTAAAAVIAVAVGGLALVQRERAGPPVATTGPAVPAPSVFPYAEDPLYGLSFTSPTDGWANTSDIRGHDVFITADGGDTWRSLRGTLLGVRGWFYLDPIHAWTAHGGGPADPQDVVKIARTSTRGRTWSTSRLPASFPDGFGRVHMHFINARTGWVAVAGPHLGAGAANIFATSDGGATWRMVGTTMFDGPIVFQDERNGWGVSSMSPTALWRTTDGGVTWREHDIAELPAGATLSVPKFGTPRHGFLVAGTRGKALVFRTANGGDVWTPIQTLDARESPEDVNAHDVPFDVGGESLAAVALGPRLYRTTDGGGTWIQTTFGFTPHIVSFPTDSNGWVAYTDAACDESASRKAAACPIGTFLLRTTDGGRSWRPIPMPVRTRPSPYTEPSPVNP